MWVSKQLHASAALRLMKTAGTKRIGGCVEPRNGLEYFREEQNLLLLPATEPQLVHPTA